jgi:hypothetical protein
VGSYRKALQLLASMPVLDAWRAVTDEKFLAQAHARQLRACWSKWRKRRGATPARRRGRLDGAAGGRAVVGALTDYVTTVTPDRQPLLGVPEAEHEGCRAVLGQKRLQTISDECWVDDGGWPAVSGAAVPQPQG